MARIEGISGSGGLFGGGTPAPPRNAEDTLRSEARIRVVDLLGEGPIEGLVDGAKSIFFDDTPLLNADETENFPDVTWGMRFGTPDQDWMPGFSSAENSVGVGAKVEHDTPVVQTITNPDVDAARLTIKIPSLWVQGDDGSLKEASVVYKIEYKREADSSWITWSTGDQTLTGKTMGGYEQDHYISLRPPGSMVTGPWDFRLTRVTEDAGDPAKLANEIYFQTLTAIIESKFIYPDTAYLGLEATAASFGGQVPTRSFHVRGLHVRVPQNYNPETRAYTGIWDGTWKTAYTNNPVWCLIDLLTSRRYGLDVPIEKINVATLYMIAQYCDELVSDGYGNTEPRYALNVVINDRQAAFDVINKMVSSFLSMVYYGSGGVYVTQDSPRDPDFTVNNTNVIDGRFTYETASEASRHNVALVSYLDPNDHDKPGIETFEIPEDVARRGAKPLDLETFGVRSRGTARRMGRWALYTERFEDETITYRAGMDHLDVVPGMIAEVFDRRRAPAITGGRVISKSGVHVTLDRPVTLVEGDTYTFVFLTTEKVRAEIDVVSADGAVVELGDEPDLVPGAVWALKGGASQPTYWRVLGKQYVEAHIYEITALRTDLNKHALIESEFDFDDGDAFPNQPSDTVPPAPTNIAVKEFTIQIPGAQDRVAAAVTIEVPLNPLIKGVEFQWHMNDGNWQDIVLTTQWGVDLVDIGTGELHTRARTVSISGIRSNWTEAEHTITGRVVPPQDPTDLTVTALDFGILVAWSDPAEAALKWTEVWRGTAPDFFDATLQGTSTTESFQDLNTAAGTVYYYWVRSRIFADPADLFSNFVGPVSINSNAVAVNALVEGLQDAIDDLSHDIDVGLLAAAQEGLESYFRDQDEAFTRASESHSLNVGTEAAFARVTQEKEVRISENAALASSVDALGVQLQGIDGTIQAFVQTEEVARIAGDDALAAQVTSVSASVGDLSAQGAFKMQAQVAPGGVMARLAAMVRAGTMTDFATAGWFLDVISNGIGGWTRRFAVDVDQFAITNSALSVTPFAIIGNVARLALVRIADYIASDNYAEDNSGSPISGWKLNKDGTVRAVDGIFGGVTATNKPFYTSHPTYRNFIPDTSTLYRPRYLYKQNRPDEEGGGNPWPVEITRTPDAISIAYNLAAGQPIFSSSGIPPGMLWVPVSVGVPGATDAFSVSADGLLSRGSGTASMIASQLEIDPLNIRNVTKSIGKLGWSTVILSIRVPLGRTRLKASLWGAGGAGVSDNSKPVGGPGGFAGATIPVVPGEMLYLIIGEGGMCGFLVGSHGFGGYGANNSNYGSAGGLTGLFRGSVDKAGALLIAGGGGCATPGFNGGPGGAAASGGNGISGTGASAMQGLPAIVGSTKNASGGGGYVGGGRFAVASSQAAGKGGTNFAASGLVSVSLLSAPVTGVGYASGRVPPNNTNADYVAYSSYYNDRPAAGVPGKVDGDEVGHAGHGLAVLEWLS